MRPIDDLVMEFMGAFLTFALVVTIIGVIICGYFGITNQINERKWCRAHTDLPYSACSAQIKNIQNFGIKNGVVTVGDVFKKDK